MPDGTTGLQLDPSAAYGASVTDVRRAMAFDLVAGNYDRNEGNWLVTNEGKLQLIDHNRTFPARPDVVVSLLKGDRRLEEGAPAGGHANDVPIPDDIKAPYRDLLAEAGWSDLEARLQARGLGAEKIARLRARMVKFVNADTWGDASDEMGRR